MSPMRRSFIWLSLICCLAAAAPVRAATGSVIKVLPHLLDDKGRNSLSPNLFERDAYQAYLRKHPKQIAAMRFDVQWKTKGPVFDALTLRVELRGVAQGDFPIQIVLEQKLQPSGWWGRWTAIPFAGQEFKAFVEVTAWRVTLWEGTKQLGQSQSFLW